MSDTARDADDVAAFYVRGLEHDRLAVGADRLQALGEARRVCRPGGVVIAAAISRFASTLDGLRAAYLEDPVFAVVAAGDRRDGRHHNPTGDPAYFATAYFHRPEELASECVESGLVHGDAGGRVAAGYVDLERAAAVSAPGVASPAPDSRRPTPGVRAPAGRGPPGLSVQTRSVSAGRAK